MFAQQLTAHLGPRATLHRLGGDEFAVTIADGATEWVEARLKDTMSELQSGSFEVSGASCGSVRLSECDHRDQLKQLADSRMYDNKRQRRRVRDGLAPDVSDTP